MNMDDEKRAGIITMLLRNKKEQYKELSRKRNCLRKALMETVRAVDSGEVADDLYVETLRNARWEVPLELAKCKSEIEGLQKEWNELSGGPFGA